MMVSVGYAYLYNYNSEIYPTKFRALTIGTALLIARIFTAFTPFVIHFGDLIKIHPVCFSGVLAVVLIPFLRIMPETKDKKMQT